MARRPAEPRGEFSKDARVRKRREYRHIQGVGERVSLPHFVFVLVARPAPNPSGARLGITASRKVGSAVVRNRCKRLVREAFRASRELFPADIDVLVIVKRASEGQSLADVVEEWRKAEPALRRRIAEARRSLGATRSES